MRKLFFILTLIVAVNAKASSTAALFGAKTLNVSQPVVPTLQSCENFSGSWTVACEIVEGPSTQIPQQQVTIEQNGCSEMITNGAPETIGLIKAEKVQSNQPGVDIGVAGIQHWNETGTALNFDAGGVMTLSTKVETFTISGDLHRSAAETLESNFRITYKTLPEIVLTCLYKKN